MKTYTKMATKALVVALALGITGSALAEGNKKIGRVYFKMVCTVCHIQDAVKAIPPNSRTMAEWTAYMDADVHDKTGKSNPKVSYYTSKEYRMSIQDTNKAAKKFLKMPDEQLYEDVKTFVVTGAKDSDTPASCQ